MSTENQDVYDHQRENQDVYDRQRENQDVYDRQRVLAVFDRLRKPGGLRLSDTQKNQKATWFRTLVKRGMVDSEFFSQNKDTVKQAYREAFPNGMTRAQYTRTVISYIGALSDGEYAAEYPTMPREGLVRLVTEITIDAGADLKRARQERK